MRLTAAIALAGALALPHAASAFGPSDYVHEPAVEYGEREIDFKAGTWQLKGDDSIRESAASLGFGYGLTPFWFTEAYLKYESASGRSAHYDAFEWENKFQLTEHNQYFVDVGLLTEIEIPGERHIEGYELAVGPLFQFDTGVIRWNANPIFQRVVHAHDDQAHRTELGYELQARYTIRRELGVGVQAFGEMGPWDHWQPTSEQSHRIGPAIFGKVKLGEGRDQIRYNAAWLFGATQGSPKNSFRLQAEYEF
jgi:hypothetical protein